MTCPHRLTLWTAVKSRPFVGEFRPRDPRPYYVPYTVPCVADHSQTDMHRTATGKEWS